MIDLNRQRIPVAIAQLVGLSIFCLFASCSENHGGIGESEGNLLNGVWIDSFTETYTTGTLTHVSTLSLKDDSFTVEISPELYRSIISPERLDLHTKAVQYFGSYERVNDSIYFYANNEIESFHFVLYSDSLVLFQNTVVAFDDGSVEIKVGSILWDYSLKMQKGSFAHSVD